MGTRKTRFTFRPSDVLRETGGPYRGEALAMWQWFVGRLVALYPDRPPFEYINGTSSINNSNPNPIGLSDNFWEEPHRRVRQLLRFAGARQGPGTFLRKCGIRRWADLERPIVVPIETDGMFPDERWALLAGRRFRKIPNDCHPKAIYVQGAELYLRRDEGKTLWSFRVEYSYPHDASSWRWVVDQNPGEHLDAYTARINTRLDADLLPLSAEEVEWYGTAGLSARERQWGDTYEALEEIFYDQNHSDCEWSRDLADRLSRPAVAHRGGMHSGHIYLNRERLKVLRRWIGDDVRHDARAAVEYLARYVEGYAGNPKMIYEGPEAGERPG